MLRSSLIPAFYEPSSRRVIFELLVILWPFSPHDTASQLEVQHSIKPTPDVSPISRQTFHLLQVTFNLVYFVPLLYNCFPILAFSSRQQVSAFYTFKISPIHVTLLFQFHSPHLPFYHVIHCRLASDHLIHISGLIVYSFPSQTLSTIYLLFNTRKYSASALLTSDDISRPINLVSNTTSNWSTQPLNSRTV